jgi:nucleoside-diphosphate-sugar epimerase
MRIIITGASGFIGTNLIEKFLHNGFEVLNIDIKEPKNRDYIKYWKKIDITTLNVFRNAVVSFNPDYIVHLAARTDLNGRLLEDYTANTIGVDNLMKISKDLISLKKILITSSMLVCKAGYKPKDQFDYIPTTIYGESKVLTEKNVWANPPLCDWAILRPTSIWGPWFDIPYKTFFDMVLAKKYFHVGNKGCTKTYGYVENSIFQIEKILFSDTSNNLNKVFYIGDYKPINIEVWGNEIASELGTSIKKIPFHLIKLLAIFGDFLKFFKINFPMTSFRLKNMTTNNIIDLENTKKIAPNLPFERIIAIKKTIIWLKSNRQ